MENNRDQLYEATARHLAEGKIVGWYRGRMEFAPRALGNRSILGDARNKEMQKRLNVQIKFRESFRPFSPAVLAEKTRDYFDTPAFSPDMLIVCLVQQNRQKPLPSDYENLSLMDKLYYQRSDIPAVIHIDYSARMQTLHKETNPRFHELIRHFEKQTGYGVIIKTSFNVRGEPIVGSPEDAFVCFMRTDMDVLVIENYVLLKKDQKKIKELPRFDYLDSLN